MRRCLLEYRTNNLPLRSLIRAAWLAERPRERGLYPGSLRCLTVSAAIHKASALPPPGCVFMQHGKASGQGAG